jgi:hypothetical protein
VTTDSRMVKPSTPSPSSRTVPAAPNPGTRMED